MQDYGNPAGRNGAKAAGYDTKVSTPAGAKGAGLGNVGVPAQGQGVAKAPKGFGGSAGGLGSASDSYCTPSGNPKAVPKGFGGGLHGAKV